MNDDKTLEFILLMLLLVVANIIRVMSFKEKISKETVILIASIPEDIIITTIGFAVVKIQGIKAIIVTVIGLILFLICVNIKHYFVEKEIEKDKKNPACFVTAILLFSVLLSAFLIIVLGGIIK